MSGYTWNQVRNLALRSYGHVLPVGTVTFAQFAVLVKESYSIADSRNRLVYDFLSSFDKTVTKDRQGNIRIDKGGA